MKKQILKSKHRKSYCPKYDEDINVEFGCSPEYDTYKPNKKYYKKMKE